MHPYEGFSDGRYSVKLPCSLMVRIGRPSTIRTATLIPTGVYGDLCRLHLGFEGEVLDLS